MTQSRLVLRLESGEKEEFIFLSLFTTVSMLLGEVEEESNCQILGINY